MTFHNLISSHLKRCHKLNSTFHHHPPTPIILQGNNIIFFIILEHIIFLFHIILIFLRMRKRMFLLICVHMYAILSLSLLQTRDLSTSSTHGSLLLKFLMFYWLQKLEPTLPESMFGHHQIFSLIHHPPLAQLTTHYTQHSTPMRCINVVLLVNLFL